MSQQLADELRRAISVRSIALSRQISEYQGRLGDTSLPITQALDLIAEFPSAIEIEVEKLWKINTHSESRVEILRPLLVHQTWVMTFFDRWLSHDVQTETPLYLLSAMRDACLSMGLGHRQPILAIGPSNNFMTFLGDLRTALFDKFEHYTPRYVALDTKFALIRVPNLEGRGVLWAPIILGHELAHLVIAQKEDARRRKKNNDYDTIDAIMKSIRGDLEDDTTLLGVLKDRDRHILVENWTIELICDAYLVRQYGVSGIAAISEYLEAVGATDHVSYTHPPARLRIELMLEWLGDPPAHLKHILEPWEQLISLPVDLNDPTNLVRHELLYQKILSVFRRHLQSIKDEVKNWSGDSYVARDRLECISAVEQDLYEGMPGDSAYQIGKFTYEVMVNDVVLAAWLVRVNPTKQTEIPFGDLAEKGLDDAHFISRFKAAIKKAESDRQKSSRGTSRYPDEDSQDSGQPESSGKPDGDSESVHTKGTESIEGSVLSKAELSCRLDPSNTDRLVVRPRYRQKLSSASIDMRLGNKFIVFIRSRVASFDPGSKHLKPQAMQRLIQLDWRNKFTLHPNELVLAATLEYVVIPADLTAQVITRSSYGRLGLLSATAIQVHPGFHGCLTLELANLSSVPLELRPGARIAQLVFHRVANSTVSESRYSYSVGPQFSRVHQDLETDALGNL